MKAYIKPNTEMTLVEVQSLMQNSITTVTVEGGDGPEMGGGEFQGGVVDSRRHNVWDDEEEEEEY